MTVNQKNSHYRLWCSKLRYGTPRIYLTRASNFVVDPDGKTWNTLIDYVLEWEPKLKEIYGEADIRVNRSD